MKRNVCVLTFLLLLAGCAQTNVENELALKSFEESTDTFTEYIDLESAQSKVIHERVKQLSDAYGDRVRFVFRHYPLEQINPHAMQLAIASECARDQDAFWTFVDHIFSKQGGVDKDAIVSYAKDLSLNVSTFETCLEGEGAKKRVSDDIKYAQEKKILGAPSVTINGKVLPLMDYRSLESRILEAIAD